jgi:hypothetical protein
MALKRYNNGAVTVLVWDLPVSEQDRQAFLLLLKEYREPPLVWNAPSGQGVVLVPQDMEDVDPEREYGLAILELVKQHPEIIEPERPKIIH